MLVCKTCGTVVDTNVWHGPTATPASAHVPQCLPGGVPDLTDLVLPSGWTLRRAWTPRRILRTALLMSIAGVVVAAVAAYVLLGRSVQSGLDAEFGDLGRAPTADGSCPWVTASVKGNISGSGERIYHVEGGQFYERTHAERCFSNGYEAEEAGFRASLR